MESSTWANIFQKEILTDHATIKYWEEEYRTPISDVTNEMNIIVESRAIGDETFVLPSRSYLLCQGKVVKAANGAEYNAGDNIALVNGWQAFRKVEMYMNGTLVDSCDYPGYVDTILGLLDDESDYATKGSLEFRYYDPVGGSAAVEYAINLRSIPGIASADGAGGTVSVANAGETASHFNTFRNYLIGIAGANSAQAARVARSSLGTGTFWFKLPLRNVLGLAKCDKPERGIQLQIRLTRETDNNRVLLKGVLANNNPVDDGKLIISKVSLMMPSAKPHIDVFKDLNDRLRASEPVPLDYQRIWCNTYPAIAGGSISTRLLSNARRPRHVFLALQATARFADQTRNSLLFDAPNSLVGSVRVGNQEFPAVAYNSANDGFVRMYNAFIDAAGKNADRSSNSFLDFNRWKNVYPIFYFDCSANDNQFELQQDAEIVCNLTITGDALIAGYTLVAIVVSDEHKTINENGAIISIQSSDK